LRCKNNLSRKLNRNYLLTKMESKMELRRYFQVAQQGKGRQEDGPEDNPTEWLMVGDTPTQLVKWLNESDGADHRKAVWFRVLDREQLGTWSHLREVITLRKDLIAAQDTINKLRREIRKGELIIKGAKT
jgi:hypothetical protein